MAQHNRLTESKFNAIKIMLKGGATAKEIAGYMQVGEATIYRVKAAETWKEYLQMCAARSLEQKEERMKRKNTAQEPAKPEPVKNEPVKVIHEQSVTIQATHYMTEELREIKDILKIISNKMAAIVADLYGTKEG